MWSDSLGLRFLKAELVNYIFSPHLKPLLLPDWTSVGAAGIKHRAQQFNTNKRLLVKQGSS